MKRISLIAAFSAAVLSLFAVSCKTAAPEGEPPFVTIDKKDATAMICKPAAPDSFASIEAGKIYVSSEISERFSLMNPPASRFNEEGLLTISVNARTAELGFWHWLFFPEDQDDLAYRIVWFDGSKKYAAASPIHFRTTMPSDPVRFSAIAPAEKYKDFSLIIGVKNSACSEAAAPAPKADAKKDEAKKVAVPAPKVNAKKADAKKDDAKKADAPVKK